VRVITSALAQGIQTAIEAASGTSHADAKVQCSVCAVAGHRVPVRRGAQLLIAFGRDVAKADEAAGMCSNARAAARRGVAPADPPAEACRTPSL
jgi:hypothetical protein